MDPIAEVLTRDSRIAYALIFGSVARGVSQTGSDLDIAIGVQPGVPYSVQEVGSLVADLEREAGRRVDLVIVNDASPAVAYRIFRDGAPLFVRNTGLLVAQKTRAILDYLDFRPVEQTATRGALAAAA